MKQMGSLHSMPVQEAGPTTAESGSTEQSLVPLLQQAGSQVAVACPACHQPKEGWF